MIQPNQIQEKTVCCYCSEPAGDFYGSVLKCNQCGVPICKNHLAATLTQYCKNCVEHPYDAAMEDPESER